MLFIHNPEGVAFSAESWHLFRQAQHIAFGIGKLGFENDSDHLSFSNQMKHTPLTFVECVKVLPQAAQSIG